MLVPFVFDTPCIIPDLLAGVLNNAPAALPEVLKVEAAVVNID